MSQTSPTSPTAYQLALRWLAVRDRSQAELTRRLERAGFGVRAIATCLERLRQQSYLDDARFARDRAESLLRNGRLGPRGVAMRLAAAGISPSAAHEAVRLGMAGRDEEGLAREALRKRGALPGNDAARARSARFLLGRGFSPEVVSRVLGVEVAEPEA